MGHRCGLSRAVLMIAIVFSALSARAQTPPLAFQPPPPPPDMFDWIQLKSGEWERGVDRAV
jgi:hypothetical protein